MKDELHGGLVEAILKCVQHGQELTFRVDRISLKSHYHKKCVMIDMHQIKAARLPEDQLAVELEWLEKALSDARTNSTP